MTQNDFDKKILLKSLHWNADLEQSSTIGVPQRIICH